MSAGIPGMGLGGLFFVLSALLAPLLELARVARGTSTPARRRQIARQFAIAIAMIAAVDLTLRGFLLVAAALGSGAFSDAGGAFVLPLAPIGITGAVLAFVLLIAKSMAVVQGLRRGTQASRPPSSGARRRPRAARAEA